MHKVRGPEGLQGLKVHGVRVQFNVAQDTDFDGFEDWLELKERHRTTDETSVPAMQTKMASPTYRSAPRGPRVQMV